MELHTPTIKGLFVNSHIKAVKAARGEQGLIELERLYGRHLNYKNSENVPIKDEVRLIEYAVRVLNKNKIPEEQIAYEAGRLHFQNFSQTPFGKIIFSMFRSNLKLMMMQSQNIAGHVFQGVKFMAQDLGPKSVKITMTHNDYPLDHFKGLLHEWMEFSGHHGTVTAQILPNDTYEYTLVWE